MGSLEVVISPKNRSSLHSLSGVRRERSSFLHKLNSRFHRFLILKKLDYLQWIFAVVVFLFFIIPFQLFLPRSVAEKSRSAEMELKILAGNLMRLKGIGGLYYGEDVRFQNFQMFSPQIHRENNDFDFNSSSYRKPRRFSSRKPHLALVFPDMAVDSQQILLFTLATALQSAGYLIEVISLEDGPVNAVWTSIRIPVMIIPSSGYNDIVLDWSKFDGILTNSLEVMDVVIRLVQEPFGSIPLIWIINEHSLADRLKKYKLNGQSDLINEWKRLFKRATVITFPDYALLMAYSEFDIGNYFVIPGSPAEVWEAERPAISVKNLSPNKMGYRSDDFVIVIVGSQFLYRGLWLEHALVLQALQPLATEADISSLKIIVLSGESINYGIVMEAISVNLGYPSGTVKFLREDKNASSMLNLADLVIYASFLEEQFFPQIILKSMCLGKLIIAPDLPIIGKYIRDQENGYLYSKENISTLVKVIKQVISKGRLTPRAAGIASKGKSTSKNLNALETIEGYLSLLEKVMQFSSEISMPKSAAEIEPKVADWQWSSFEGLPFTNKSRKTKSDQYLDRVEANRTQSPNEKPDSLEAKLDVFQYRIWDEERKTEIVNARKRIAQEQFMDRTSVPIGVWEEIYRNAKRADRMRNELHEREDGELERTGQPLCIYEPYFGEGVWPFLHSSSLYRGIGLSSKGRRHGTDDIDASSRLPVLNEPYYRDILADFGAFFSIANRVDRIHKNAWIGFHYWKATARKESLTRTAENALVDAVKKGTHGDALYFWVRMDEDNRYPSEKDFWSFCEALNAGNCRFAFSEAIRRMYGLNAGWDGLPPMPGDGGTWSVFNSWALPTSSFLEFVMFSRMFVSALDAEFHDQHHLHSYCCLNTSTKDRFCYSRVMEVLVNVWAYHSGRVMMYVNPITGEMDEQHRVEGRRGKMWVRWFSYDVLKSMDEELAEEADGGHPNPSRKRWLWPMTGEVFWQGVYERERGEREHDKARRKQKRQDKLTRMRQGSSRQRALGGKYVYHMLSST